MLKLALLLIGAEDLSRNWRWLLALGLLVFLSGLVIFVDASDHITVLTLEGFGWLIVLKGLLQLSYGFGSQWGAGFLLYAISGLVSIVVGLLIVDFPMEVDFLASSLFATAFVINGLFQLVTAWVIRFPGWKVACLSGLGHLVLGGMMTYGGWQKDQHWVIPLLLGLGAALWGSSMIATALQLRRIDRSALTMAPSLITLPRLWSRLLNRRFMVLSQQLLNGAFDEIGRALASRQYAGEASPDLTVYVWTPTESADNGAAEGPPLVSRYVAAVDTKGKISTGHAALEMPPEVYVSLYPRQELNATAGAGFLQELHSHDIEGSFLPSYAAEVASWMPATVALRFTRFNPTNLCWFAALFKQDSSYNLTNRNCSVAVALTLDAALAGSLAGGNILWTLIRLITSRHLWVAALVRKRAEAMVWTPGLVLDYSLAMQRLLDSWRPSALPHPGVKPPVHQFQ